MKTEIETNERAAHTPEPWHANGSQIIGKAGRRAQYVADVSRDNGAQVAQANAARIVACVNACAGIDPAAIPYAIDGLKMCITDEGANCLAYGTDTPAMRRRLAEITRIAKCALSALKGVQS